MFASACGTRRGDASTKSDLGTEVAEDRRELTTGVGAADHHDRRWQPGQVPQSVEGERELRSRDRGSTGVSADGDDHRVPAEGSAVQDPHRVRVDERGWSGLVDQVDPVAADEVGQSLLLVCVVGDPSRVAEGRRDVHVGSVATQAELRPRSCVTDQPGGPGQRADRSWPLVQAGAAEALRLDQGDVDAELTSLQRGSGAGGSAAEYETPHDRPDFLPVGSAWRHLSRVNSPGASGRYVSST